jgi:hypothetical protein
MTALHHKKLVLTTAALIYLASLSACNEDTTTPADPPDTPTPEEITIEGVGQHGIFDPSLAHDPETGLLWMSYSEVEDSQMWPDQNVAVQTRLAWSDDAGDTWTDTGSLINPAEDLALPLDPPNNAGTWEQEVPALIHDPGAPADERWKLIWMRYLQINHSPAYMHGWLALKTAPGPAGPWSAERKLFAALGYDAVNDATIGPPEVFVNTLDPELSATVIVAEPGILATDSALYVTMLAAEAEPGGGKIALLKWPHPAGPWQYLGSFLTNADDAPQFGFEGFSAPELFNQNGATYLIVTPQNNDSYQGTMVFEVTDLETATLRRAEGVPTLALEFYGTDGTHNGAAGYHEQATGSGLIYSEVDTSEQPLFFRIFKSGQTP